MRRVVAEVNQLAPDLVLMTGDYISNTPRGHDFAYGAIYRCADLLRELACPLRFAAMGNHDSILGAPNIREALATASIPLLVNQHVAIERAGERLWLCGHRRPPKQYAGPGAPPFPPTPTAPSCCCAMPPITPTTCWPTRAGRWST